MALRISLSYSPSIRSTPSSFSAPPPASPSCSLSSASRSFCWPDRRASASTGRRALAVVVANSNVEAAEPAVGQVTEVDKDTFWPLVKAAGEKIVVLDMYTQRCGPCKVMAPKFQELSEKYLDVVFMKLDCNQENKSLAKELGIRVVPTFKILKDSKVVKEITGAKFDDLVFAIETVKSS